MHPEVPDCPLLPEPAAGMDWRHMARHGEERGAEFYLTSLQYGRELWRRKLAARAILCLDRAMGADLAPSDPVLEQWPLPYAAMAWFLGNLPPGVFTGNPRVHFQHYAGRMNEPRREQRRARAWACWHLSRIILPHLPGDPKHVVNEPSPEETGAALDCHGHPGERQLWESVASRCRPVDLGITTRAEGTGAYPELR